MGIDPNVSFNLNESILRITGIAHNDNLAADEKQKQIAELAIPALQIIESASSDAGGGRKILLDQIRGLIEGRDWATLPTPKEISLTLEKINRITVAINDVQQSLIVDATEMFRELLDIMRKMLLENKFAQTAQYKMEMKAAEEAKIARTAANQAQYSAELGQAIAQIVGGVTSIVGSGFSISSIKKATKTANAAKDLSLGQVSKAGDGADAFSQAAKTAPKKIPGVDNIKSLDVADASSTSTPKKKLTDADAISTDSAKTKSNANEATADANAKADVKSDVQVKANAKAKLELEAKVEVQMKADATADTDTGISNKTTDSGDSDDASTLAADDDVLSNADVTPAMERKIRTLEKEADIEIAWANAYQSLGGATSSLVNSFGAVTAAVFKNNSNLFQQEAEQDGINKDAAEKMYQASAEGGNAAREGLRSVMQMITALEQSFSNMGSLLARNSV